MRGLKQALWIGAAFFLISASPFDKPLSTARINLQDNAALQRGAKVFMNYCSGCHSLKYLRYNAMAKDLGLITFDGDIDEDLLYNNLIFTSAKMYDPIVNSMPPEDAQQWFGKVPPDLSLKAREKGPDWIFTYLKSFYVDPKRPFGSNNTLLPDTAMPNVLAPLMGKVVLVKPTAALQAHLLLVEPGEMHPAAFDSMLEDLVTFLTYVSEPVQRERHAIGIGVLLFLLIFIFVAYRLKQSYWRKIKHN